MNAKQFIYFNREGTISTLSDRPLKLVEKFTSLDSNISSTVSDVKKAWTTFAWLSITWKSVVADKIKRDFIQVAAVYQ